MGKNPALICARLEFLILGQSPKFFEPNFIYWTEAGKNYY